MCIFDLDLEKKIETKKMKYFFRFKNNAGTIIVEFCSMKKP